MKPYYQDSAVTIYCGDCREILPSLEPMDLVLTDPPYGIGKAEWDDSFPTEWLQLLPIEQKMLVATGVGELAKTAIALGLRYRDCIVMHSRNGMTRAPIGFGNWFPMLACGDWDWGQRPNHISFNISLNESIPHPSPKPLEAIKRLIRYYAEPNWIILDPFVGSGTTLKASKELGIRAIGIEIEERYCEIAAKRMSQEVLQFTAAGD